MVCKTPKRDGELLPDRYPQHDLFICDVGDAVLKDGVFERSLDVFLADQLRECLRPVLPGDDLVHEGRLSKKCQAPGDPRHTG